MNPKWFTAQCEDWGNCCLCEMRTQLQDDVCLHSKTLYTKVVSTKPASLLLVFVSRSRMRSVCVCVVHIYAVNHLCYAAGPNGCGEHIKHFDINTVSALSCGNNSGDEFEWGDVAANHTQTTTVDNVPFRLEICRLIDKHQTPRIFVPLPQARLNI